MRLTVITPCFNPGRFLLPMLESVARQGDVVAKHIVMDGGSTDGTLELLKTWAEKHPWFEYESEPDNGQAHACAKALEKVDTEYFAWLNADDILCDNALVTLLQEAEFCAPDSRPAIVYGDYLRMDADGNVYARRRQPSFNYWDCLHGYITVQNVAAIFNTELLRKGGGFDPSLRFVMDYDIVLKLGRLGEVRHVKNFCGAFRLHEASKTATIEDVCNAETEMLRVKYGVPRNKMLRWALHKMAKARVAFRMLREGIMADRFR